MDTSEIRYRVADFLKQHPPFTAIDDQDLVDLAAHGRVRFFAADEFLAWQGEPHKTHVLVIQQGTVSLWDEHDGQAELRDVRGPGDWVGAEQFHGAPGCLYTARATTDVVTYGFPSYDLEALLERYPYATAFVAAMGSVASAFTPADAAADPLKTYLQQLAGPLRSCSARTTVGEAARQLLDSGVDALAVTGDDTSLVGVVTPRALLAWLAHGGGDAGRPLSEIGLPRPGLAGPDTSIADGAWAMSSGGAVAMTADGTAAGRLLTVLTPRDLLPALGDQPAVILEDIGRAADLPRLRALNHRARAFVLKYLTGASSTDWMLRFATRVDDAILARVFTLTGQDRAPGWCVCGTSGRGESLPLRMPHLVLIDEAGGAGVDAAAYARLTGALTECGYLPGADAAEAPEFSVASADEWVRRYVGWIRNPVIEGMQRRRELFDLRPLLERRRLGARRHRRPRRDRPRHPADPRARLPRGSAADLVLRRGGRRALRRAHERVPAAAQRPPAARRPRARLRHGRPRGDGHLHARPLCHGAAPAAGARADLPRGVGRPAHRALAAGARGHQGRARSARSCRRRC